MKLEEVVGVNVARLREHKRMSQAELGDKLGQYLGKPWTRQAVSAAEKGRRAFAVAELVALASTLEADMAELLSVMLAVPDEEVELPGASISMDAYSRLVEPPNSDDVIRSIDLRNIQSLIPMLKNASWTTQMLYVTLRDLFLGPEARAKDAAEDAANKDATVAIVELLHTMRDGDALARELKEKLEEEERDG